MLVSKSSLDTKRTEIALRLVLSLEHRFDAHFAAAFPISVHVLWPLGAMLQSRKNADLPAVLLNVWRWLAGSCSCRRMIDVEAMKNDVP